MTDQLTASIEKPTDRMHINGITYNLNEWLTIANYAKKHNVGTNVVTNWIRREVIPTDCVIELPLLNNIRLIKDRLYK